MLFKTRYRENETDICRLDILGFCRAHGSWGDENGVAYCVYGTAVAALDGYRQSAAGKEDTT